MPDSEQALSYWEKHALAWRHFRSPLRPADQDVRWMEQVLGSQKLQRHTALLLGATPELASMAWPTGTRLIGIDQSAGMLQHVWPSSGLPEVAQAVCGDWECLPLPDSALDAIVGDGVLAFFLSPNGLPGFAREIRRVLTDTGLLLVRVFVRPPVTESLEQIHTDLAAGSIGNFHAYKWRLVMALQPSLAEGVKPADVWQHWRECWPDSAALAAASGWPQVEIDTIDAYREARSTYYFPTLEELHQALEPYFEVIDSNIPDYELGDRCPSLALRPRRG